MPTYHFICFEILYQDGSILVCVLKGLDCFVEVISCPLSLIFQLFAYSCLQSETWVLNDWCTIEVYFENFWMLAPIYFQKSTVEVVCARCHNWWRVKVKKNKQKRSFKTAESCSLTAVCLSSSPPQGWTPSLYMLATLCWVSTSRSAGRCASRQATGSGSSKACGELHCGCSSLTCCTGRNSSSKYKPAWSSFLWMLLSYYYSIPNKHYSW